MGDFPKVFFLNVPNGDGIYGNLNELGVVTFTIKAGRGSPIRGTEMFDRMMEQFGKEVLAIQGVWRIGADGEPSVNIDKVNELTSMGVPLEEAILQTWTVAKARKWGFVRVRLVGPRIGSPGAFEKIDVFMEKES